MRGQLTDTNNLRRVFCFTVSHGSGGLCWICFFASTLTLLSKERENWGEKEWKGRRKDILIKTKRDEK